MKASKSFFNVPINGSLTINYIKGELECAVRASASCDYTKIIWNTLSVSDFRPWNPSFEKLSKSLIDCHNLANSPLIPRILCVSPMRVGFVPQYPKSLHNHRKAQESQFIVPFFWGWGGRWGGLQLTCLSWCRKPNLAFIKYYKLLNKSTTTTASHHEAALVALQISPKTPFLTKKGGQICY